MKLCEYARYTHCTECNTLLHKECKKFVVARAKMLCKEVLPFTLNQQVKPKDKFCWGRDVSKVKSACFKYASRIGQPIRKLTINQVLAIVLSNEEFEGRVLYIDYTTKVQGDADKVKGVIQSFIDQQLLRGSYIGICVGAGISCQLDIEKKL